MRCNRLIASRKLLNSRMDHAVICRQCYSSENSLIKKNIERGTFFTNPLLKFHPLCSLISEDEKLFLTHKYKGTKYTNSENDKGGN